VTANTKGIIINSPSNPTGAIFSEPGLALVAKYALERGWVVISDDIYDTIVYGDGKLPHILNVEPALQEQVVVLNGVSKSFAMTGWRIGYCAGPKHIIAAMNKIQSQSTSNACSIAQKAALAAVTGPQDFPGMMKVSFAKRLDAILAHFQEMPGVSCVKPQGAFYVFPNLSAYYGKCCGDKVISGSVAMADYLLDEALIATVPGAAFGSDAFVRFSFATSMAVIDEGMQRLQVALAKLA
jgi:aspartate aminotransferase